MIPSVSSKTESRKLSAQPPHEPATGHAAILVRAGVSIGLRAASGVHPS